MSAKSFRISLKPAERIYINGAVIRVDRRVSLEFLNDVQFLLENHVLQAEQANTPLRQLTQAAFARFDLQRVGVEHRTRRGREPRGVAASRPPSRRPLFARVALRRSRGCGRGACGRSPSARPCAGAPTST